MKHTNTIVAIAVMLALGACGGGGSGSGNNTLTPPTLALSASADQTLAGGKTITLSGKTDSSTAPTWSLSPAGAGVLSTTSGASVSYTPPAAVAANTPVTVTATIGGVSKTLALTVFPEPGAPGLSLAAGKFEMYVAPVDGPAASARFRESTAVAGDLSGNLYVLGRCRVTQTRRENLSLRKISTDGVVSTLGSCYSQTWFGKADTDNNTVRIYKPNSLALDRAGNVYIASYNFDAEAGTQSPDARAIYKITPQGVLTVLAGAGGAHVAALTDGKGDAARFLTPTIAGVDADDNLYVQDRAKVRKITPAGEVSTIATLPAALTADQDGNHYRVDQATGNIIKTTPAGADSVIAGTTALAGVDASPLPVPYSLVRTGPVTYALLATYDNSYLFSNDIVLKLVVPH